MCTLYSVDMDTDNQSELRTTTTYFIETDCDESNNEDNRQQDQRGGETERQASVQANSETMPQVPLRGKGRLKLGSTGGTGNNASINSRTTLAGHDDIDAATPQTAIYLTQYCIDHDQQSEGLCREVLLEDCVPCFNGKQMRLHCNSGKIVLWLIWAFVSSELLLYALHVTSIIIGALNEGDFTYCFQNSQFSN